MNPYSGDGGLYQFYVGTWLAHGGGQFASAAQYATRAQQDQVVVWTYESDGFGPWRGGEEHCWE